MNLVCYYYDTLIPIEKCRNCPDLVYRQSQEYDSYREEYVIIEFMICPATGDIIICDHDIYLGGNSTYSGMYKGY